MGDRMVTLTMESLKLQRNAAATVRHTWFIACHRLHIDDLSETGCMVKKLYAHLLYLYTYINIYKGCFFRRVVFSEAMLFQSWNFWNLLLHLSVIRITMDRFLTTFTLADNVLRRSRVSKKSPLSLSVISNLLYRKFCLRIRLEGLQILTCAWIERRTTIKRHVHRTRFSNDNFFSNGAPLLVERVSSKAKFSR